MNHKPLKNKLKGFDAFVTYTGTTVALYGFHEEDVKSAVEGLKEEIERLRDVVYSEKEFTDEFPDDIQQSYLDCYNLFLSLIDKYFEDVI